MSLTYNNKTLKLLESKTVLQPVGDIGTGRIERTTYSVDVLLNNHLANLYNNKDFLKLLYPFII